MPGRLPLVALLAFVGCTPASPGTAAQELLSDYAPDLEIGDRVSEAAHDRYDLLVSPYTGYRDSTYTTSEGLGDLIVVVNEYVDDRNPRVSRWARIATVMLQLHDTLVVPRLIERFSEALGAPIVDCHASGKDDTYVRWYWPGNGDRGVMLVLARSPWRPGLRPEGSFGGVAFGVERPDLGPPIAPEDCVVPPPDSLLQQ